MKDFNIKEREVSEEMKRHMEKYNMYKASYVKNIKFEPNTIPGLSMFYLSNISC